MIDYWIGHTAEASPLLLGEARWLLEIVFDGDFGDDDWEHSLGGVHVVARDGTAVVGHAAVVQRRLLTGGRALRTGYVEGVGVHPDVQRRGIGGVMMAAVERIIGAAYDLGALGASDEGMALYTGRGWQPWKGTLSALTPAGVVATPDEEGAVLVLTGDPLGLDLGAELTCDWRDGDVW